MFTSLNQSEATKASQYSHTVEISQKTRITIPVIEYSQAALIQPNAYWSEEILVIFINNHIHFLQAVKQDHLE